MEDSDSASESASATVRRMEKGSHLFVVKNYSLHRGNGVGKGIESEEFVVGGHVWRVCFFPDGRTVDSYNSGFASLYVLLNSSTSVRVRYLFDMFLLDQSGRGKDNGFSLIEEFPSSHIASIKPGLMYGCPEFIERATLDSPDYLKDDCLKFRVTLGVFTCRNQNLPLIKVPESNFGSDFGELLRSEEGADVFFKVGNESFCAHKLVLAASCPVLLSHPSDCHQPNEINVPDMEPKIFKAMLSFVYTGVLPEERDEDDDESKYQFVLASFMGKMLAAADRYELKRLKEICAVHISRRISGKSVAYLLHLAQLYRAEELKVACFDFIAENGAGLDVMDSEGFKYLKDTCPLLFLELAYKENCAINGHQERDFCSRILSIVKETFVSLLAPEDAYDEKHKIKEV